MRAAREIAKLRPGITGRDLMKMEKERKLTGPVEILQSIRDEEQE